MVVETSFACCRGNGPSEAIQIARPQSDNSARTPAVRIARRARDLGRPSWPDIDFCTGGALGSIAVIWLNAPRSRSFLCGQSARDYTYPRHRPRSEERRVG